MVWVCWRVGWRRLLLQEIFSLSGDKRCCVRSEGGVESKTSFFNETLSDEVGFGETREISLVDRRSLTETARAVNFERRRVRGQLGPKDSRSELREEERPNRKRSTSQREGRWDTRKRRPIRRILQHMVNWRKCSEGNSGSSKHEAKAKVRARVPLLLDVDHQQETVNMVQALKKKHAEGNPVQLVTRSRRRGICT